MPFATAHTVSLHGALGHLIDVQADVSPGTVGTTLIGRPDVSLNEARDRCRMAVINSGLEWPMTRRVTVLLAPADLTKSGTHFDLAIAVSVLAAADRVPRDALTGTAFVGELDPVRRPAVGSRSPADGAGRRRSAASPGCSCPNPRRGRRRWCPG